MAGNWKMNLNHLEAILLVQKLAFSLTEKQLTDVEVVVLPPFTDLRSVQTLIDGDKLLIGYGAQDLSPHPSGAYTGDISGAMLAKLGCTYVVVGHSERRAVPPRGRRAGQRQGEGGAGQRHGADPVRRRGAGGPRGRRARAAHAAPSSTARSTGSRRAGREGRGRLRAGVGDRHRQDGDPARTRRRSCGAIRARLAERYDGRHRRPGPHPLRRLGQGAATSPRSWPSRTSTARWSAGPAWTPRSSSASAVWANNGSTA